VDGCIDGLDGWMDVLMDKWIVEKIKHFNSFDV
jgi:hypothetical protein